MGNKLKKHFFRSSLTHHETIPKKLFSYVPQFSNMFAIFSANNIALFLSIQAAEVLDRIKEGCIRASAQGHYDYSCVTTVCEEARKGNRGWVWHGMAGSNPFPREFFETPNETMVDVQDGAPKIAFSCLRKVAEIYGLWQIQL